MLSVLPAFGNIARIKGYDAMPRTALIDQLHIEPHKIKPFLEIIPVALLTVFSIACHVQEIITSSYSHKQLQQMFDKFLPGFIYPAYFFYYCADKSLAPVKSMFVCLHTQPSCFFLFS